jgi:hypothetical protein
MRRLLINRLVGFSFVALLGGLFITIFVWGDPYLWPFIKIGRRTSFFLGCRTLVCIPIVWTLGIVYTYVFSVILGAIFHMVLTESSTKQ